MLWTYFWSLFVLRRKLSLELSWLRVSFHHTPQSDMDKPWSNTTHVQNKHGHDPNTHADYTKFIQHRIYATTSNLLSIKYTTLHTHMQTNLAFLALPTPFCRHTSTHPITLTSILSLPLSYKNAPTHISHHNRIQGAHPKLTEVVHPYPLDEFLHTFGKHIKAPPEYPQFPSLSLPPVPHPLACHTPKLMLQMQIYDEAWSIHKNRSENWTSLYLVTSVGSICLFILWLKT